MSTPLHSETYLKRFLADYGMVLALIVLIVFFSVMTIKLQHPTGSDAGRQVAQAIVSQHGANAGVVIVTRSIGEDLAFSAAAEDVFNEVGADVLDIVNGSPVDLRGALQKLVDSGARVDAIAANNVTAKWNVYNRFPEIGIEKCVTPSPYRWPDFLKLSNLLGVANQTAIYAVIAIGMTLVIVTAGIDLSVGSLVALASVSCALVLRDWGGGPEASIAMVALSITIGIGVCAIAGAFSGVMITAFRLPPFIATLGMMMIASGIAFRWADGRSIPELPASFLWLGGGQILGIPNTVWLMLMLYVLAHIVMSRTVFGRYVYAIGGNEEAARLSGVPIKRMLLVVYTTSGALAGLGGIVQTSQLAAGDPKFGLMYELEVIAAVVVGGASLMGGRGKIFGTLIGAFIIAVIKNGMNLTSVDPFNQRIVLGAVLLAAVLLDTLKRRAN